LKALVRELAPLVASHLANHRAFALDHFIVRERQDEILGKRVDQAERVGAGHICARHVRFRRVSMPAAPHGESGHAGDLF